MKKLIFGLSVLLVVASISFAGYKILCAHADITSYVPPFVNELKTQPDIDAVDVWDLRTSGMPTLDQLKAYDGVMTWSNYAYPDPTGWGNRLADYVDSGKYAVFLASFAYGGVSGCAIGGKMAATPYNPMTPQDGQYSGGGATLNVSNPDIPNHPILDQVSSLWCQYYNTNRPLTACGVSVCKWTNGQNGVAYSKSKRVVGLTGYPGRYGTWVTGQYPRLVRNAFVWMLTNWTSVEPSSLGNIKAIFK
ncbi:MAG: hypothetical protein ACUVWP_07480 [bacterium]